ncbi:MAG: PEP-CTERM sorting domain-containing protein [Planctomycetota bacterium]
MSTRSALTYALAATASLTAAHAFATAHVVNEVVDISGLTIFNVPGNGQSISDPIPTGSPFTVTAGDTVDLTYTFADGYRIRLSDPFIGTSNQERLTAWSLLSGSGTNFSISDITLDLLGVTASPGTLTSLTKVSESGGSGHLGPQFLDDNIIPSGGFIEFTGITASFTVDSLTTDPQVYDGVFLLHRAPQLEILAPIPEPATAALTLLAIAGLSLKRPQQT